MSWGVATQNGVSVSLASIVSLSCGATEFSPASLFTSGVAGAWYDPSDYSTLFQDSAGTTPVTAVEQPVGLMLDKSQGLVLGSELVAPIDFNTGWTASGAAITVNSATSFTSAGISNYYITPFTVGRWYVVTINATFTGASANLYNGTSAINQITPVGLTSGVSQKFYFLAVTTAFNIRQSSAGTVTVNSITVKELSGNHASQATAASRPVLRARYNLLTYSEQFDNAAWSKTNVTLTANAIAAPDGTLTADNAAIFAATAVTSVNSNAGVAVSVGTFTVSCYVKANGVQYTNVGFIYSAGIYSATQFDLTNGTVVRTASATYTSPSATITPLSNGWYRCTHTATVTTTTIFPFVSPSNALWTAGEPRQSLTGNGTDGIYIWGADLRTGSSAGTYQRIAAATDYATAGFLPYLALDGTDDSFGTNSIDFSATDKMSVCAGVTKLSDAATAVVTELSATINSNNGSFVVYTSNPGGSTNYQVASKGAFIAAATATGFAAPVTNVLTSLMDISGDSIIVRANAVVSATGTGDQGTGNYGNWPLYIGRRNNTTLPFNGRIYQLIVCGKTLSASELASTEAYVNSKTGAY